MLQQSLTLPSITPNSLPKPASLQALKFKKLPVLKDDICTDRPYEKQPIQKYPSKSISKRNLSSMSLMTSSQRKQHKKQKLMMNVIEKKIRQGRYDENEEVSADLNSLKGQQSECYSKVNMLDMEINKLKQRMVDVRKERQAILSSQSDLTSRLDKIKKESDAWRQKCDVIEYERAVNMNVLQRQISDFKIVEARVNKLKDQMKKKRNKQQVLEKKGVDFFEKEKSFEKKFMDLKRNNTLQNKKIKEMLGEKEKSVQLRAINQIERWERKRQLIEISEAVMIEESEKAFNKQYHQILGHLFLSGLLDEKFERLIQNNSRMLDMFNQASNTYGPLLPQQYHSRYYNSAIERSAIEQNIKKLEKSQSLKQEKNKRLEEKLNDLKTQYLQMGLQLEKEHNMMQIGKPGDKSINHKIEQKICYIETWISNSLKRLEGIGCNISQKQQRSEIGLNRILQQLAANLLQQTK